ncbi:MAG: hypothetical protein N4A45_10470 [Flavobacteriales bacterium]|jgi:hypothetical protein|nr:hypothetical protein [Flavobacteriales bacterium]
MNELKLPQISTIQELQEWEQKQHETVNKNPFIEISDTKSLQEAKKRRTALRTARTEVEKGDKVIAKKINEFRKGVIAFKDSLIEITKPHEAKQQEEINRYEKLKLKEKEEKLRKEKERVDLIRNEIESIKIKVGEAISKLSFGEVLTISDYFVSDFDFQEFSPSLLILKESLENEYKNKITQLQEEENRKLEAEKLKQERAEFEEQKKLQLEKERRLRVLEEERQRIENEKIAKEKKAIEEEKRKIQLEKERLESIRLAKEKAEKLAKERARKEKEEQEIKERLKKLMPEKEKIQEAINSINMEGLILQDRVLKAFYTELTESIESLKEHYSKALINLN